MTEQLVEPSDHEAAHSRDSGRESKLELPAVKQKFYSLRTRLLLPLLSVAIVAALGVAIFSYWLGDRWARQQIATRCDGISRTLAGASFPLNRQVVQSLADLTKTDMITLDRDGAIVESSIDLLGANPVADFATAWENSNGSIGSPENSIVISGQSYRYVVFSRAGIVVGTDRADRVAVLFSENELQAARLRAAGLPLATGLSTIFLLASVTLWLAGRLVRRLTRLQLQVDRIAEGNFDAEIQLGNSDEIALLGTAVKHMSGQLEQMWQTLHRQHGQKLLHQIAGGLAHQLRNSTTGARMAVELHQKCCPARDDDSLDVALSQLEQTEDHVRRLLRAAAGQQDKDRPGLAAECIGDVQTSLAGTAQHLQVELTWRVADDLVELQVADTPSLAAAVSNLVLNAMQAATAVEVAVAIHGPDRLRIEVTDNGPGPPAEIADEVFEPFVTSKPEGLGLGLPLVKRSAERLGGQVEWSHEEGRTSFVLMVSTSDSDHNQTH